MKLTRMTLMAMQYLNSPYVWAENGPFKFDCSGLVLKVLHDVGITLPDQTANQLYEYAKKNSKISEIDNCDNLLFFGNENYISHVAISIGVVDGVWLMLEAGGSGRESVGMSKEELGKKDARVRIKPVDSRSDLVASIYIPYKEL